MTHPFSDELFSVFETEEKKKKKSKKRKHPTPVAFIPPDEKPIEPILKKQKTSSDEEDGTITDLNKSIEDDDEKVTDLSEHATKIVEEHPVRASKPIQPTNDTTQSEGGSTLAEMLSSKEECLHDVALPKDYKGENPLTLTLPPKKPAKEYPFKLDAFQREAVKAIENNQSVLVAAHTSAGKTAVAEYAIAAALRDGSRVVYTSPIKALSNQKYREMAEEFQDVGLMTGDVTISPNASCLIMTTEILRSMLFRGSEVLHEVSWVIFDEVHYMRDVERGLIWEETMVLLPNSVRYVFLSATIPNALEFANWIAQLKDQPVHVVYTDYRPTPLQHYVFPAGGDGIHLTIDEKGNFKEENFQKALSILANPVVAKPKGGGKKMEIGSDCYKIVKMVMERNYQPVIVFSFSKRDCEEFALQMAKLDLNDEEEKGLVEEVFNNAIDSLSDDDKKLPQVEHMLPLLKRGIGIHHSGLLPIIKEVIEILFQEGLVKALFATETFAMGLNMPARTVVFTSSQKWDGKDFRPVSSGEYIQMSGRAGRRGIDDRGIVILMLDKDIDQKAIRTMMKGKPDPLNSQFRLSYFMIVNLLRVEDLTPEYIIERSFYQYQCQKKKPEMERRLQELIQERDAIKIENEQQVESYANIRNQLESMRQQLQKEITKPIHSVPFLQPGRLVRIRDGSDDWGWGVVVNFQKKKNIDPNIALHKADQYIVDVLLECTPLNNKTRGKPKPIKQGESGEPMVIPVQLSIVESISSIRLYVPKNLRSFENKKKTLQRLHETIDRFKEGIPVLDPIEDMHIEGKTISKIVKKIESLENRLSIHPLFGTENIEELYQLYQKKAKINEEINNQKKAIKATTQMVFKDELKKMLRVLRRLEFTDKDNVLQVKGRVACEISTGDELLLTEMLFTGVFNDLTSEQCIALLSCFVYDSKPTDERKLPEELEKPYQQLKEVAQRIAKVTKESKIEIDVDEFVNQYSPDLMEVTYAWCKGAKFYDICKMTDAFEGSIVRSMRRLEELARQMCSASRVIGDDALEKKFLEGITKMKRDIVFSSSLYL